MSGEWVTTNGFDVIFHVSDGSTIEIMEQPDASWHCEHWVDGNAEFNAFPTRQAAMQSARDYMKVNGLKSVPSPEQRAAPWFKGDDFEYTVDRRGKRQFANGLTVIDPPGVQPEKPAPAPVKPETSVADQQAAMLNAMLQAFKLNELLKGK